MPVTHEVDSSSLLRVAKNGSIRTPFFVALSMCHLAVIHAAQFAGILRLARNQVVFFKIVVSCEQATVTSGSSFLQ